MENRMQHEDRKRITTGGRNTLAYSTTSIRKRYPDVFPDGSNGFEWENFNLHPLRKDGISQDRWIECGEFDCWIDDLEDGKSFGRYKEIEHQDTNNQPDLFDGDLISEIRSLKAAMISEFRALRGVRE